MIKNSALFTFIICVNASAGVTPESCLDINRSVGVSMTDALVADLDIKESDILVDKTKLSLISTNNVTPELAETLARKNYSTESTHFFSIDKGKQMFMESNAKNIIVKYDYINHKNKHIVTLASLLINDDECSVNFNGYIIVKREF